MEVRMNIGIAPSRNYDKVVLEMVEETIEYKDVDELKAKIRKIFNILSEEVDLQFSKMQK